MTSKNDITGDSLVSKKPTEAYRNGWDQIFGKKNRDFEVAIPFCPPKAQEPKQVVLQLNNYCNSCGKWKGAHAILPGQPTNSLCFCPTLVNGQWEGRPAADFAADHPDDFKKILDGLKDGTIIWS